MREFGIALVLAGLIAVITLTVFEIADDGDDGDLAVFEQSTPTSAGISSGAQLFVSSGCAACHGASGEGGVGPALAGHTAEQVIRQARRPLNVMPLFTADELSDEELERIATFVLELASDEAGHNAHDEPTEGLDPRDEIAMHHWMALSALRAGSKDAAAAHVSAVIAAVGGEHEAAMAEALTAIETGDLSAAESIVVEMLAGFTPDVADEQILVRLALQALVVDDLPEAIADVESAIELADSDTASQLETALDALNRGDLDEAQERLASLSGLPEHEEEEAHAPEDEEADADHDDEEADDDHDDE